MSELANEQIQEIINAEAEGATHATSCRRRDYLRMYYGGFKVAHKDTGKWLTTADVSLDELHNLSDLREILTLRERIAELKLKLSHIEKGEQATIAHQRVKINNLSTALDNVLHHTSTETIAEAVAVLAKARGEL